MAETTKNYLLGFVVFTAIILSGIGIIGEFMEDTNSYVDSTQFSTFNSTFNKFADLNESANTLKGKSGLPSWRDAVQAVIELSSLSANILFIGLDGISYIVEGFGFITDSLLNLPQMIPGFPNWAAGLIVISIIITFALVIIQAYINKDI